MLGQYELKATKLRDIHAEIAKNSEHPDCKDHLGAKCTVMSKLDTFLITAKTTVKVAFEPAT